MKWRHYRMLLIFIAATTHLASAQQANNPTSDPPAKEQSTINRFAAIEQHFQSMIDDEKLVGCSGLVHVDGKTVFTKHWGKQNRRKDTVISDDTIWRIYSMSKPITTVAVMQLVDQGKVKLDALAETYLPEFKELKVWSKDGNLVECKRKMTVKDLMRHTSGLSYGFFGNTEVDRRYRKAGILVVDRNIEQTVTKLSKIPLLHQPGTRWHYSVANDVLGRIVEVASGEAFDVYLKKNVFDPLEMKDTGFWIPEKEQKRLAEMYVPNGGKLRAANPMESYRFLNKTDFCSGGGGLCSTVRDYLNFCKMLLGKGKFGDTQILSEKSVEMMTKNQLPPKAAYKTFKYGYGVGIDFRGRYSWGGAAGTRFWIDPKNKTILIFMVQIKPDQLGPQEKFKQMVYDALEE